MNDLDAHARGKLAERLVAPALELAGLVHGDGDAGDIAAFIAAVDPAEKDALLVVLAALVDTSQSAARLLSFVTWDEFGRPMPEGPVTEKPTRGYVRTAPAAPRRGEPCGTYSAYRRHQQKGEPVDEACKAAGAKYMRDWRANKRRRAA